MRCCGNSKPELSTAERTRSRLSRTAVSGKPTMVKDGRPLEICVSTLIDSASLPWMQRLYTVASDNAFLARRGDRILQSQMGWFSRALV